jgi:MarR family transcriptional regulator, organic hydroperoxide resistance regulator
MTAEPNRRQAPAPEPAPEPGEPSLPERLFQALAEAGPPNQMAAGLIERIRSGGAAVRAAGPASLNPSQLLMNRLRPSRMLEKAADQELRPMGFGLYGAMAVDFIARQATPPRLADISRFLMQEPQSLTTLIQRLERRGWIRREPSEFDRRAVLLELTEAGRQLHERLVRVLESVLQDFEAENFGAT